MLKMMTRKQISKVVDKYDADLLANDPRYNRDVRISFDDGGQSFHNHAFLMRNGNWVIVFTEHNGCYIYDKNIIASYKQYRSITNIEELV